MKSRRLLKVDAKGRLAPVSVGHPTLGEAEQVGVRRFVERSETGPAIRAGRLVAHAHYMSITGISVSHSDSSNAE
jgi:hypothetical protein